MPPPDSECELSEGVVEWKRGAVLALWGYVGSELRRLPVAVDFDADARALGACLEPGASVPRPQRKRVARGLRAVESTPRPPACLAGRRLSLADEWVRHSRGARSRQRARAGEPENRCSIRDAGCGGFGSPVCGLRSDGRWADYGDRCQACRDPSVVGWDARPCALR
jgi:hypothetical protein